MLLLRALVCICCLLVGLTTHASTPPAESKATADAAQPDWDAFGLFLQTTLTARDWKPLSEHLDSFALTERTLKDIKVSLADRIGFQTGLVIGLQKSIFSDLEQFSEILFQRTLVIDDRQHLRFRCRSDNGAVTFLSFICKADDKGRIRWYDTFSFSSGEFMTDSLHRAVIPVFGASEGRRSKLSDEQNEYLQNMRNIQTAAQMIQNGDPASALAQLDALPEELQSKQFVLLRRFQAAQQLDEEKYLAVIEQWERLYPDDPALDLISIDSTFMRKDYAGTIARIDSLNRRLGSPDAYLLNMKGGVLLLLDKKDEARAVGEQALQIEPSLASSYDLLLSLAIGRNDYAEVTRLLRLFDKHFPEADIDNGIQEEPLYADYLKSSEYSEWLASRPRRTSDEESPPDGPPAKEATEKPSAVEEPSSR